MLNKKNEKDEKNFPKSPITRNSLKDFAKICRAYYNDVLHISKIENPSISKNDLLVLDSLFNEVILYSSDLIKLKYINEAKSLIELGLVISDFLLKIFGKLKYNQEKIKNLFEKLHYPLSRKLVLLEVNFSILFNFDKNYNDAEKNLEEIMELQQYLNLPNYNIASSKFYLSLINFYLKNFNNAEKFALEALDILEKKDETKTEKADNYDNKKTIKMLNLLELLTEIYLIKKDYNKAKDTCEKVYYLNLGKYGAMNSNTTYFKKKLSLISNKSSSVTANKSQTQNLKEITSYNSSFNNQNKTASKILSNNSKSISASNKSMTYNQNILHKGMADTFSFKIPTSNFYEPFLISIYSINNSNSNKFSPELFVCNLCFDKTKLLQYLEEAGNVNYIDNDNNTNNNAFYTDDNLNIILEKIELNKKTITFSDYELKSCLINIPSNVN